MNLPKVSAATAPYYAGAALGVIALLWLWRRGVGGVAQDITRGAVNVVGGAASGAVIGTGEVLGIPATSQTQCRQDLAAGNTWAASFSCPAGTFLSSLLSSPAPSSTAPGP